MKDRIRNNETTNNKQHWNLLLCVTAFQKSPTTWHAATSRLTSYNIDCCTCCYYIIQQHSNSDHDDQGQHIIILYGVKKFDGLLLYTVYRLTTHTYNTAVKISSPLLCEYNAIRVIHSKHGVAAAAVEDHRQRGRLTRPSTTVFEDERGG